MKNAFSLIELIFAIALIAIISGIGFTYTKGNYLQRDGEFILLKIKQARFNAIGNDDETNDKACVTLTKSAFENSAEQNPYLLHVNIKIKSPTNFNSEKKLCFDSLGRPYNGNINSNLSNVIKNFVDVELSYLKNKCTIRVHPLSGYGIILCN